MNVSDSGAENFSISIDTKEMQGDVERIMSMFKTIGETATKIGSDIDRAFGKVDTGDLQQNVDEARDKIEELGDATKKETDEMSAALKKAATAMGAYFSVQKLVQFEREIISIRSTMESLQTSFTTLAGQELGGQLFEDLKEFELRTPMMMQDLAQGAQMMLGFNIPVQEVMEHLKAIGDISMGDSEKFKSLTLAFSQMSATGKLMGQDLLQMINAGFNPLQVISQKTGKSIGELKDEMSKGAISAKQVQEAFHAAAAEGGQFNGMLDKQSKTMKGALSNLEGAWQYMLNDIGEQQEGLIVDSIDLAQRLIANYKQLGQILLGLVSTFGIYRAAVMVATVAMNGHSISMMAARTQILLTQKAQAFLNATMLSNPYVAAATALGVLVGVLVACHDSTTAEERAQKTLNDTLEEAKEKQRQYKEETDAALQTAQDDKAATEDRTAAMNLLIKRYPSIIKKYIDEEGHLTNILELKKQIAEIDGQKPISDLRRGASEASSTSSELEALLRKRRRDGRFSTEEQKRIHEIEEKYLKETGRSRFGFTISGGLEEMRDYYKNKAQQTGRKAAQMETSRNAEKWMDSLAKATDGQIDSYVKTLQNAKGTGKKVRFNIRGLGNYTYSQTDIGNMLIRLQGMQEARSKTRSKRTYTEKDWKDQQEKAEAALEAMPDSKVGSAEWKRQEQLIQEAQDHRAKRKPSTTQSRKTAANKAASEARKQATAEERLEQAEDKADNRQAEEEHRYAEQQAKQAREDAYAIKQAEIDGMEEGERKKLEQAALNHQKEVDQLEEQRKQLYEQKVEHEKALWDADPKNKGNGFWSAHTRDEKTGLVSGIADLTDEEKKGVDAKEQSENTRYAKEVQDILQQSLDAMIAYYKEFGTLEQQRYAIAKDYDEKIAKAATDGEKRSLEAQKQRDLASAGASSMAMDIDWSQTFEGVGNVLGDVARETLRKVEDYMKTDEFKNLKPSDQKAYTDLRSKLTQETGGDATSPFNFKQWGTIAKQVKAYQDSVRTLQDRTKEHGQAVRELEAADKQLAGATDDASRQVAQAAVDAAQAKVDETGKKQDAAKADTNKKQQQLTDSTQKATNGLNNFANALQQMSSGSLYGFANGITKLVTGIGGTSKALSELGGKIGSIVGAILQILDALGDDPKGFIDDLFEKITNTVEKILQDLPKLVVSIVKDVGTLVGGVIEGIGGMFGADDDWLFGGNAKEVEELTDRLTKSNDALKTSIDSLKDKIDEENGVNSITDTQKAIEAQKRVNQNTADILEAQMGYHGHHHSNSHYWNLSGSDYGQINRVLAEYARRNPDAQTAISRVGSLSDMYKLTPEQMNEIRTNLADVWTKMLDQGKYDKSEYWENYADLAGEIDDLTDNLREKLTGITFDSMHDDFVDKLMDMSNKASDFTKDLNKQFAKSLLNFAIGTQMDTKMKKWWQNWADTMEKQSGNLTESQIDNMRKEYEAFVQEGMAVRDKVFSITGYNGSDYSQDSSKSVLEGVTQDQVQELNGRMTSVQINLDRIAVQVQQEYEQGGTMLATAQDIRSMMDDMLDLQYQGIGHLQKIETYTSELPEMHHELRRVRQKVETL